MKRKSDRRTRSAQTSEAPTPDVSVLLEEIEKEPVPERLLELALKLQKKLVEKRRQEEEENEAPRQETKPAWVKESP